PRAPLWQQRKRAADLLAVASRYGSFPVLLETYRECLRDFFDMPALTATLSDVRSRKIRVVTVDSETPSPFAASLLFTYVASFIYDGDAPLAERRAQALAVDQAQLRELIGDAELRELLDSEAMDAIERQLQRLDPQYHVKSADGIHDMLLSNGDSSEGELRERAAGIDTGAAVAELISAEAVLVRLTGEGRLVEGEFRPGGLTREWTDAGVLRMLRRRSLAKLRREVEPVDQPVLGRFTTTWQGIVRRRQGADALVDAIEQLQGSPLPASILETEILPARIDVYDPADLDAVTAAGEVVWVGVEPLGDRDGRVALYLADHLPRLLPPTDSVRSVRLPLGVAQGRPPDPD